MSEPEDYVPPKWLRQVISMVDVYAASARVPNRDAWLYSTKNPDRPREEKPREKTRGR